MLVLVPFSVFVSNQVEALQAHEMEKKDDRIKLMNEILGGIKVLKLYAWEPSFEEKVLEIRDEEVNILKKSKIYNSASAFIWSCTPFLVI